MTMATHYLNEEVDPKRPRPKKRRKKDAFNKFFKETPEMFPVTQYNKLLEGFLLLETCGVEQPQDAIKAKLNGIGLSQVKQGDFKFFVNLSSLELADNQLSLEKLVTFPTLVDLSLMCNQITSLPSLPPGSLAKLESLNLSYNSIPANSLIELAAFPKLSHLDLASNKLCTLPTDLSDFKNLRELSLAGNNFSSDSVMFMPSQFYKALATLPRLKKLNLAHNQLRGISSEELRRSDFRRLEELDFSYNWVDDQQNLLYAQHCPQLQVLVTTGNPFASRVEVLKEALKRTNNCTLINEVTVPYKLGSKKDRLPYPRPIAMIAQDFTTAIKNQLFGVELSRNMNPVSVPEMGSGTEEDLFPESMLSHPFKDIFTPSEDRTSSRQVYSKSKPAFFVTEGEESLPPPEKPSRLNDFRQQAKSLLGSEKEYERAMDLQSAYKQLKHMVSHPRTYKHIAPKYAAPTMSRNIYNQSKPLRSLVKAVKEGPSEQFGKQLELLYVDLATQTRANLRTI
jgi:hypothetical protein